MTEPSIDDAEAAKRHLDELSRSITKQEHGTQRRTVIAMAAGLAFAVAAASSGLQIYNFTKLQVQRAEAERAAAVADRIAAERLARESQREAPVVAVSPNGSRTVSKAGLLLDSDGLRVADLGVKAYAFATFSPDGRTLILGDRQKEDTRVFDAISGRLLLSIPGRARSATFSPDSKSGVLVSDGAITQIDFESGSQIRRIQVPTTINFATFVSPEVVVIGGADGTVLISNDAGGTVARLAKLSDFIKGAALSADQKRVLVVQQDGRIVVLDRASGSTDAEYADISYNRIR